MSARVDLPSTFGRCFRLTACAATGLAAGGDTRASFASPGRGSGRLLIGAKIRRPTTAGFPRRRTKYCKLWPGRVVAAYGRDGVTCGRRVIITVETKCILYVMDNRTANGGNVIHGFFVRYRGTVVIVFVDRCWWCADDGSPPIIA